MAKMYLKILRVTVNTFILLIPYDSCYYKQTYELWLMMLEKYFLYIIYTKADA